MFYCKAVEFCPGGGCGMAVVTLLTLAYPASRKDEYDGLLERVVPTLTPTTGRLDRRPPEGLGIGEPPAAPP